MFNYSKIECQSSGVMFYNVMLNEKLGPLNEGDIFPYAYLSFDDGTILFGEDTGEGKETTYKCEFHVLEDEVSITQGDSSEQD